MMMLVKDIPLIVYVAYTGNSSMHSMINNFITIKRFESSNLDLNGRTVSLIDFNSSIIKTNNSQLTYPVT